MEARAGMGQVWASMVSSEGAAVEKHMGSGGEMEEDNDAGSGREASVDINADHMGGGCCGEGSAEDHHTGAGNWMEDDSGEGRVESSGADISMEGDAE